MEVMAVTRHVKVSPTKAVDVARSLRGLPVSDALRITDFGKKKASAAIGKTLKSAIANAVHNAKLSADDLRVKEALVDVGPTSRRYWAKARGMYGPILRRTCHIKIVLSDSK